MILLGSAVQTKGLGLSFVSARKRLIAPWRSTRDRKTPRLSRRLLSLAKKPSTALSRETDFGVSARDYLARIAQLRALSRSAAPRLDAVDVIASPTLCLTPPLMSEVADADSHLRVNRRIVRNTVAVNYLGLCAITVPVGRDRAGMPVGLQLTAPAGAEERLLAIALAAERVLGTAADRLGTPPLLIS
jgi:aspartyl-tRNA(Asn)/glutamyl-tRNA(Gln) amidotransferase subunit A